ncbi:MAG: hypothetical protein H7256_12780 [Bdellovibrio sp.]|nr:hypothetical protein [Bdellovibrio sp.]
MRWSSLKVSLLVVLSFSMVMVLISFMFYKNINILLGFWEDEAKLSIYLKVDTTEEEKGAAIARLKTDSDIANIQVVTRNEAAADFKKILGEYSNGLISVDEITDLIPESIVVTLQSSLSSQTKNEKFAYIKRDLTLNPVVEEISYGTEWIKQFSKFDRALKFFGLLLFSVLSISVLFISALMARSLVEESKTEIEVLSLIGATRWFIYKNNLLPFFYIFGLSAAISTAITFGTYFYFKHRFFLAQGFGFLAENIRFLDAPEVLSLVCILFFFVICGAVLSLKSAIQRLSLFAYE